MRGIRAALAYVDGRLEPNVTVQVEEERISGIVSGSDPGAEDWGNVALLPGTVNAHGHAFQSLFKGFADDRPFDDWRDEVLYPFSERLGPEEIYVGALFAFAEALLAGTTTTVDFFYLHDEGNQNAQQVIRAARDIGIRLVFARALYDLDAPSAAPARYRESAEESARRCLELARAYENDETVSVQPAPHSLHAASPETIARALEVARKLGCPCHLHLAEAAYERDQIEQRYGTTPVRLLEKEGLLQDNLVTIHTVWVDDEELDMLARSGVGVVHCPGANAFLGDGIARVPEMLERGVRVALGPDGGCANNRQSIFDEMRMASLVAKARLTDGSALSAPAVLEMGTRVGADLLDVDAGAIAPGKLADFVAIDLDDLSLQPRATVERQIVHSMQSTAISKVVVGGRVVVDGGRTTQVPQMEIVSRVNEVTRDWSRP
ncbi:MAG: amidohydrolase family protein [Actinomycetota bacterium]|nr:amidohydrolase family protein [Actinomycetota bacterium]